MNKNILVIIIFITAILVIMLFGIAEEKRRKAALLKKIRKNYGKRLKIREDNKRMEIISGYYKRHISDSIVDDITYYDLDMDILYNLMDYSMSEAGEEYLYYMLRTSLSGERDSFEEDVRFLTDNNDIREDICLIASRIGHNKRYSMYDYIDKCSNNKENCSNLRHYAGLLALVLSIAMLFVKTGIGLIALVIVLSYQIITYFSVKSRILPYVNSFEYIMRLYNAVNKLGKYKDKGFAKSKLASGEQAVSGLKSFAGKAPFVFASSRSSGSVLAAVRDYFNIIVHLDLIMFNRMMHTINDNIGYIDELVGTFGYIEAAISIGSFRTAYKYYCIPVFGEEISAKNIYHPYIEKPVKNSFELKRPMLVTGSNASGKSTFLKTVALNMIMARSINTCLADEFKCNYCDIYSSMSLKDNLVRGDSYYMAEIKAIKRIIDNSKERKVMCFVDEVLSGTNTVERIAASTEILKYFNKIGVICVAATHDIELTTLLENEYENYHFEENITDGDIHFAYKLLYGKATSRNAISLLKCMGYSDDIVENARLMADNFVESGIWKDIKA